MVTYQQHFTVEWPQYGVHVDICLVSVVAVIYSSPMHTGVKSEAMLLAASRCAI